MIPTWMIEELERLRREREHRERPQLPLELELPVVADQEPPRPTPREPIVIEFGTPRADRVLELERA